jgi:hypothetical protein
MVLDFRRILSVYQELFLKANFGRRGFSTPRARRKRGGTQESPPLSTVVKRKVFTAKDAKAAKGRKDMIIATAFLCEPPRPLRLNLLFFNAVDAVEGQGSAEITSLPTVVKIKDFNAKTPRPQRGAKI